MIKEKKFYSPLRIVALILMVVEILVSLSLLFTTLVLKYPLLKDPKKVTLHWFVVAILVLVVIAMCRLIYLLFFHRNRERNWDIY